jgi:hypothetical protein
MRRAPFESPATFGCCGALRYTFGLADVAVRSALLGGKYLPFFSTYLPVTFSFVVAITLFFLYS